jgi:uncharacterized protein YkwD
LEDRLALSATTSVLIPWSPGHRLPGPAAKATPILRGVSLAVLAHPRRHTPVVRHVQHKPLPARRVKRVVIAAAGGGQVVLVADRVPQPQRNSQPTDLPADILTQVNQERALNGLQPLTLDPQLVQAAQLQADNMAQRSDHAGPHAALQHTLVGAAHPTLTSRLDAVGYAYQTAGENIAYGYHSAVDVMSSWLNSAKHRENLLSADFSAIGIAVRADAAGRLFFCQVFGAPQ